MKAYTAYSRGEGVCDHRTLSPQLDQIWHAGGREGREGREGRAGQGRAGQGRAGQVS